MSVESTSSAGLSTTTAATPATLPTPSGAWIVTRRIRVLSFATQFTQEFGWNNPTGAYLGADTGETSGPPGTTLDAYVGDGASFNASPIISGSDTTNWYWVAASYPGSGSAVTVTVRRDGQLSFASFTIDAGGTATPSGYTQAWLLGDSGLGGTDPGIGRMLSFGMSSTARSAAQLRVDSVNKGQPVGGTWTTWLPLTSAATAGNNAGTGASWTVNGTLTTSADAPTDPDWQIRSCGSDASTASSDPTVAPSIPINASGLNRGLIALVSGVGVSTGVTACTFNGTTGTRLTSLLSGTNVVEVWWWNDAALPSSAGTYSASVTVDGASGTAVASLHYHEGVSQSAPTNFGTASGTGTSLTANLTSNASAGSILGGALLDITTTDTPTDGAGQLLVNTLTGTTTGSTHRHNSSAKYVASGGANSLSWSGLTNASAKVGVVVELLAFGAGGGPTQQPVRRPQTQETSPAEVSPQRRRFSFAAFGAAPPPPDNAPLQRRRQPFDYGWFEVAVQRRLGNPAALFPASSGAGDSPPGVLWGVLDERMVEVMPQRRRPVPQTTIAVTAAYALCLESIASGAAVPALAVEALAAKGAIGTSPLEALSGLSAVRAAPVEALAAAAAVRQSPVEALAVLAAATTMRVEALASISAARSLNVEALAVLAVARALNVESLAAGSSIRIANIEALASLAAARTLNLEALGGVSAVLLLQIESTAQGAVVSVQTLNIESLGGLVVAKALPIEGVAALSVVRQANAEALSGIAAPRVLNVEALAALAAARSPNLEALQGVLGMAALPIESLAQGVIVAVVQLNIESLAARQAAPSAPLEGLASVSAIRSGNVEALRELLAVRALNIESITAGVVTSVQLLNVESLAGVAVQKALNLEALAVRSIVQVAQLESFRGVVPAVFSIPIEALGGVRAVVLIPIEAAGIPGALGSFIALQVTDLGVLIRAIAVTDLE